MPKRLIFTGDLENKVKVAKILSTFNCVTKILYNNFGQNPSFGSRESMRKQNVGKNLSKSTLSPLPTMYLCKFGQNLSTSSEDKVRIRSYVDVVLSKFDISKCSCNLENKVKVTKI